MYREKRKDIDGTKLLILFVLAIFVVAIIYALWLRKDTAKKYESAIEAIENENYEYAEKILVKLLDYKDGAKLYNEAKLGSKYKNAVELFENDDYIAAIQLFEEVEQYKDSIEYINESKYLYAKKSYKELDYDTAKKYFEQILDYKDAKIFLARSELDSANIAKETVYQEAINLLEEEYYGRALEDFRKIKDYKDSADYINQCTLILKRMNTDRTIAAGVRYSAGIQEDGNVEMAGADYYNRFDAESWTNIKSIDVFGNLVIGLTDKNKVLCAGELNDENIVIDTSEWNSIIDVAAGEKFIIAIDSDGNAYAQGHNGNGQTNVKEWKKVIAVDAGWSFAVGLTEEQELVYSGHDNGQTKMFEENKAAWKDVVNISAAGGGLNSKCKGGGHTVGLKKDGTVVAIGDNSYGQCEVEDWTDIVAIDTGDWYTVGVTSTGKVLITGQNSIHNMYIDSEFYEWEDIVEIAAGFGQTIGVKSDGTTVAIGYNNDGERDGVKDWKIKVITN